MSTNVRQSGRRALEICNCSGNSNDNSSSSNSSGSNNSTRPMRISNAHRSHSPDSIISRRNDDGKIAEQFLSSYVPFFSFLFSFSFFIFFFSVTYPDHDSRSLFTGVTIHTVCSGAALKINKYTYHAEKKKAVSSLTYITVKRHLPLLILSFSSFLFLLSSSMRFYHSPFIAILAIGTRSR